MSLVILFDVVCFSKLPIEEFSEEETRLKLKRPGLSYVLYICEAEHSSLSGFVSFSRLLGKKVIKGFPVEKSGIWPYEKEEFCDFIVGVDELGDPVEFSCNQDLLANYFGKNPGAPHFLTPIFFRREVLGKYYDQPGKYSIGDGHLSCGSLWLLQLDNNHPEYVIVFLGDLDMLPYPEQLYWRSFNMPPDGTISSVAYRRSFRAEFAEPESADLIFKVTFERFQEKWHTKFGWQLFRCLSPDDVHFYKSIRIPITEDQAEFDSLVLALTKVMIDSLNDKEIGKAIGGSKPDEKSISKLERFLDQNSYPGKDRDISFLRDLQSLRSTGSVHRKGATYLRVAKRFGLEEVPEPVIFEGILDQAVLLLDKFWEHFLTENDES